MGTKAGVHGFTLIELVAVLVLLGIISISVFPRFSGRDGLAEYALRDELLAVLRFAQHRATFDHSGACYRVSITSGGFEPQRDGSFFGSFGQVSFSGDYSGLSVIPTGFIYFDGLGNVVTACGGVTTGSNITLSIGAAQVIVYPTGFIKAG